MTTNVEQFWAEFFGVPVKALRTPGVTVVPHKALGSYEGAWLFVRDTSGIVSCPPEWVARVEAGFSEATAPALRDPSFISGVFHEEMAGMIGPSYQGYLEPAEFRTDRHHPVRPLSPSERPLLEALLAACPTSERGDSGIDPERSPSMASYADGCLVSVAQHREWSPRVGDPCVLTRPSHRCHAHGTAVVSAVIEDALARGALVLYQTLLSNASALRLAHHLGFRLFASNVAVRLHCSRPFQRSL